MAKVELWEKVERIKDERGQDTALGYAAYCAGKNWASKAANFIEYRDGQLLAQDQQGNVVHAGMLRHG